MTGRSRSADVIDAGIPKGSWMRCTSSTATSMSTTSSTPAWTSQNRPARTLRLPVRAGRFWLVQAGVLLVVLIDVAVLDVQRIQLPFGMPASMASALLLVPVINAALNFGVRGAIYTALWASVLMVPDWIFREGGVTAHAWVEVSNLAVVNAVAVVVGQRVEREEQARRRAEQALRASEVAEARYRGLFDEQASPVLVTASAGVVTEANTAALRLLGADVRGHPLSDLVEATAEAILAGQVSRLAVQAPVARTG